MSNLYNIPMFDDLSNVDIGITKFSDSVVYQVNSIPKKQEVLFLCEAHTELSYDKRITVVDNTLHRTFTFKAEVFVNLFKDYSDFRVLRKTLDLSKHTREIGDNEFICVYIRDPFEYDEENTYGN